MQHLRAWQTLEPWRCTLLQRAVLAAGTVGPCLVGAVTQRGQPFLRR